MSADDESSGVNARQQAFSTESTGVPDKQGYMVKQGQLVKNWKKRWFVLDKGVLQYFELPDDTVPKGQMSLFGATVRFLPDAVREHCIEVSTTNRYLRCATDDDKEIQAWKEAIESAVDKIVADSEAPKWKDGDKCEICSNEFSFTNRKHHCRACGGLFCSTCADKALPLPQFGMHVPVRVCNNCYMASRRRSLSTINLANVSDETIKAAAPVEDEDSSPEVEDQKEDADVADDAAADEPGAVDQAAPADDDEDKTKEEEEAAAKAKAEEEAAAKAKEEAERKAQEEARKAKEEEERLASEAAQKAKLEEEARLAAKAAKEQEEARRKEEEARKIAEAERQAAEKAAAEAARKKAEEEASLKAQQEEEERKKREAAERQKAREEKEAIAAAAIANGVTEQPAKPAAAAKADDTAAKKPVQRTFTLKDRVKRLRAGVTMWKLPHWGKAKQTKVHLVKSGKQWGVSWESKKSNHTMMLKECELLQGQQTDMFKKDKFSQFGKQAELSFSLKSSKRTLDLVCLNAEDYNTWISTIQEIIFS